MDTLINDSKFSPLPARLSLNLPDGIGAAAVLERKRQILAANPTLPHLTAEKFAVDAERCQLWHDHPEIRTSPQAHGKTEAELLAQQIASIDRAETRLDATPEAEAIVSNIAAARKESAVQ
jgi:hypothetical protein